MRLQKDRYSQEVEEINRRLQEINLKYDTSIVELQDEQDRSRDLASHIEKLNEELKRAESTKIKYEHMVEKNEQLKALINEYRISMPSFNKTQDDVDTLQIQENTAKSKDTLHIIN